MLKWAIFACWILIIQSILNECIDNDWLCSMNIQLIDNEIKDIINGARDIPKFNQPEHAGVCSAGPLLVGAILVCDNAREGFTAGSDADGSQTTPANWQIDEEQERQLQQWAEAKGVWECKRLATKTEIDAMVATKGFHDNGDTTGVNYISDRLHLEDMHPANVFVENQANQPVCIDCIVKFVR